MRSGIIALLVLALDIIAHPYDSLPPLPYFLYIYKNTDGTVRLSDLGGLRDRGLQIFVNWELYASPGSTGLSDDIITTYERRAPLYIYIFSIAGSSDY